jgi:hypothetical protein
MPDNPGRIEYSCHRCNTLPCRCLRNYSHKTLSLMTFRCTEAGCSYTGETVNQLQEHRLDIHLSVPKSTGQHKPAYSRLLGAFQALQQAKRATNGSYKAH